MAPLGLRQLEGKDVKHTTEISQGNQVGLSLVKGSKGLKQRLVINSNFIKVYKFSLIKICSLHTCIASRIIRSLNFYEVDVYRIL